MRASSFPRIDRAPRLALGNMSTPFQLLERVSERYGHGARIWVKRDDMTGSVVTGNKVRKLEYIVAHAKAQGCDTLITCGAVQSNHCRATAIVGAQLGMKVHLILRGDPEAPLEGNYLLDTLAGANVSIYTAEEYQQTLPDLMRQWDEHYASEGHKCWQIPTGGSDDIGVWGYVNACEELALDFERARITAHTPIVCASGSGGTQAGLALGAALVDLPATIYGVAVCDDAAYFDEKVKADVDAWIKRYAGDSFHPVLPTRTIDRYIGPGYGKAQPEVLNLIREIASLEGLFLDPVYTGKAFFGMVTELANSGFGKPRDVVFIHTGGIFGLLAQCDELIM